MRLTEALVPSSETVFSRPTRTLQDCFALFDLMHFASSTLDDVCVRSNEHRRTIPSLDFIADRESTVCCWDEG